MSSYHSPRRRIARSRGLPAVACRCSSRRMKRCSCPSSAASAARAGPAAPPDPLVAGRPDFARRVHAAFDNDPRVEVHDPEPSGFDNRSEFQISNDPITLLTQRRSSLPRFLFARGELWRVGDEGPLPVRLLLFPRGGIERPRPARCLARSGDSDGARPATPQIAGVIEPLVSIVVPIYDRTAEIIRLAHSIYEQDYPWIEVVFVSNGSPAETIEAIRVAENYLMKRRFGVRIIELDQACGSATIPRDLGIRASSGDLICVLDSDDWLDPGFFDFLRKSPWRDDTLYYPKKVFRDHGRAMGANFRLRAPALRAGDARGRRHDFVPAASRQFHEQLGGLLRPRRCSIAPGGSIIG